MTERYEKVNTVLDLPESLKSVVQFQVVDGNVEAVTVKINDQVIRIVASDSYSHNLKILKEEAKEEKFVYIVSGTISDVEIIPKGFVEEHEADDFISSIYSNGDLKKEKRLVLVDKVNL